MSEMGPRSELIMKLESVPVSTEQRMKWDAAKGWPEGDWRSGACNVVSSERDACG